MKIKSNNTTRLKIKTMKTKFNIIIWLCVVMFYSCDQKETTTLKVSTEEILLDRAGLTGTEVPAVFEVSSSNKPWILTSTSWLIPSVIWGGVGVTEVLVSATGTTEEREGYITVQSGDVSTVITVKQSADELIPSTLTLLSAPTVEANGLMPDGSKPTVSFSTNKRWTIIDLPRWITVTPTSGNAGTPTVTLTVNENNFVPRTSDFIITAGSLTKVVSIDQKGDNRLAAYSVQMLIDEGANETSVTDRGSYFEIVSTPAAGYPWFSVNVPGYLRTDGVKYYLTFEYQLQTSFDNLMFVFFKVPNNDSEIAYMEAGNVFESTGIAPNNEDTWRSYRFDATPSITGGWGNTDGMNRLRIDLRSPGNTLLIRDIILVVELEPMN
jgi:hypothetical protein